MGGGGAIDRRLGAYQPHVMAVLRWLLPLAALAWVVISGLGRSLALEANGAAAALPPVADDRLAGGMAGGAGRHLLGLVSLHRSGWRPRTFPLSASRTWWAIPCWVIFLSLGFFTAWALVSWALSIAPLLMLLEDCSALSALGQSLRLGKAFTGKLVEINLVMGIVNLALIVLAMVLSAAPLPFSDQLGPDAMHVMFVAATVFYFVASDYFQVVRLKGFMEFWKMFQG